MRGLQCHERHRNTHNDIALWRRKSPKYHHTTLKLSYVLNHYTKTNALLSLNLCLLCR